MTLIVAYQYSSAVIRGLKNAHNFFEFARFFVTHCKAANVKINNREVTSIQTFCVCPNIRTNAFVNANPLFESSYLYEFW